MKSFLVPGVSLSVLLCAFTLQADVVKLKDGRAIEGIFLGGNSRQIDFLSPSGKTLNFPLTSVGSVTFSALPGAASSGAAPGAPKAGAKYRASLDDPIMVGGAVVIPKGADATLQAVKVQQSGKMKGSDLIQLKVISVSVRGATYPVVTSVAES